MVLTIIAAFLGYVLPWGQMSFWGATVIINLLSVLPIGKTLVIWLWGGFYVSHFTCRFFYAVHFIVPLMVLALAGVHLYLLHFTGRSSPRGISLSGSLKLKFFHYFLYKDAVNLRLLWGMLMFILAAPDWSADPVNFVGSDMSSSPLHIQPEWYFLHLYAVLRSIPNKLGGLIGFVMALVSVALMRLVKRWQRINQLNLYSLLFWVFVFCNLLLLWLGMQAVEEPYIMMGQIVAFFYFRGLVLMLILDISSYFNIWKLKTNCNFVFLTFWRKGVCTFNFRLKGFSLQ